MATVVEALARNKVVALLVPSGGVDTRDIPALALTERLGSYAGECFAGTAQAVEFRELLKAAFFGGALVIIERERRRAERVRTIGAKGDVGVTGVVGNAGEVYARARLRSGFSTSSMGVAELSAALSPLPAAFNSEPSPVLAPSSESSELPSPDSSRATRSASSSVRLGLWLLLGQGRRLLIALRRQQLGRPVERSCKQRKSQHHGGADGKYLLVGGLARHGAPDCSAANLPV